MSRRIRIDTLTNLRVRARLNFEIEADAHNQNHFSIFDGIAQHRTIERSNGDRFVYLFACNRFGLQRFDKHHTHAGRSSTHRSIPSLQRIIFVCFMSGQRFTNESEIYSLLFVNSTASHVTHTQTIL